MLFLHSAEELKSVAIKKGVLSAALVLCDKDHMPESDMTLLFDWICETPDDPASYVCFAGKFSSDDHDNYDWLDVTQNRYSITTWHDEETADETAFFFNDTVYWNDPDDVIKVIIGKPQTSYESELLAILHQSDATSEKARVEK